VTFWFLASLQISAHRASLSSCCGRLGTSPSARRRKTSVKVKTVTIIGPTPSGPTPSLRFTPGWQHPVAQAPAERIPAPILDKRRIRWSADLWLCLGPLTRRAGALRSVGCLRAFFAYLAMVFSRLTVFLCFPGCLGLHPVLILMLRTSRNLRARRRLLFFSRAV